MGRLFIESVMSERIFKCKCCKVDSASRDDVVSKDFRGRFGKAYLFRYVVNVSLGPSEDRHLMTGWHTVNDVYCSSCQQILGWKYEKAFDDDQKYKEGMYILEKERMFKEKDLWLQELGIPRLITRRDRVLVQVLRLCFAWFFEFNRRSPTWN